MTRTRYQLRQSFRHNLGYSMLVDYALGSPTTLLVTGRLMMGASDKVVSLCMRGLSSFQRRELYAQARKMVVS